MNLLIIGTDDISIGIIQLALQSKYLDKIYTASSQPLEEIPNVEFLDFEDLVSKVKALHIDVAITHDKELIKNGIVDVFKQNGVNIICANKKWQNLELSRLAAKKLMEYYSINTSKVIKAPLTFPIILKTYTPETTKIIRSMPELLVTKEDFSGQNIFLEEYLDGKFFDILFAWDGKNLLAFDKNFHMSEVQIDRLELFKTKLNFLLSDEEADFIGLFTTRLTWARNDWYVRDFLMRPIKKSILKEIKTDFLFLLNAMIYQKLNEL